MKCYFGSFNMMQCVKPFKEHERRNIISLMTGKDVSSMVKVLWKIRFLYIYQDRWSADSQPFKLFLYNDCFYKGACFFLKSHIYHFQKNNSLFCSIHSL